MTKLYVVGYNLDERYTPIPDRFIVDTIFLDPEKACKFCNRRQERFQGLEWVVMEAEPETHHSEWITYHSKTVV